ncbi:MAG: hypothetical protein NVS4B7_16960 [Ktedonobacteraceae bacterium]
MVEFHASDFKLLLNTLDEGICYFNARGELVYHNSTALTHWHLNASSHVPTRTLRSHVARALAGEHVAHELVNVTDQQALLVNSLPLVAGTPSISGAIVISRDVSEHTLLEKQAQIALQILTEAILATQSIDDLDEILLRFAALISQMESVDRSIAFRLDDTTGKLTPLAFYKSSEQDNTEKYAELVTTKHDTENAIQQRSPAYLQAIRLARTFIVDFTLPHKHSNPHKLFAAIYAPVLVNQRVVGLLGAERQRPLEQAVTYFPQWSADLLTALARLASMSVEKAEILSSLEQQQRDTEATHTQLNQKEEFLLRTAHDLKNPLTTILGQAQILHRRLAKILNVELDTTQQTHELLQSLKSIEHQTRRIEHLIDTVVEISRIDLNRLELYIQDVDLLRLVRRTLIEHLLLTSKHTVRLCVDGEPVPVYADDLTTAPSVMLRGDEKRLEQTIIHLLSNATKYSPAGSPITVSLQHADEGVELSMEDRGIGIPVEELQRVTERFYRTANATNSKAQGLGLGLYLVHSFVTRHGGHLAIQSNGIPGEGSRFSITLPSRQP